MNNIFNIASNTHTEELANNLRKLIVAKKISEAELARQTNIPQPTLHKILAGKTTDPRTSTLKALANYFDVSIDCMLNSTELSNEAPTLATQSIPIIAWENCINYKEYLRSISPNSWDQWVVSEPVSTFAFALSSKPSMEPKFPKGSTLIIDPSTTPEDGDLIIAHFANTNTATLRTLSIDGPISELSTVCKQPKITTPLCKETKIIGVVVKSVFRFL